MRTAHLQNENGLFAILELDANLQLAESLGLDLSLPDNIQLLETLHRKLSTLGREVTGLVLDPIFSFHLLSANREQLGVALRLEQDKPLLTSELPPLFPNFSLEEIKNNYALVKLALTYHPQEEQALAKKQLLAEIREYSRSLGIDFLLKLQIPSDAAEPTEQVQLDTVVELRSLADILVLEAPSEPLAVATVSSELDIPWLAMASAADSYDSFKERFRMAMENGASGYCIGQLLWRDLTNLRSDDHSLDMVVIDKYIATTLRDRLIELNRIASEGVDARAV